MHATYRLQFRQGVDFAAAAGLAPYLKRLGASHLYASPIFHAAAGSTHGYDVVNPNALDPVLGGAEGFERLHAALGEQGLKLIVDIVPNHMAVGEDNPWWWDALARGAESPYAGYFDIDWEPAGQDGHGRVALPMLGAPYAEELQAGNLKIVEEEGRFRLAYFDRRFPLAPASREALAGADLAALNGDQEQLHQFLEAQNFRLIHWRAAPDSRNWRRFFDIDNLIGVRVDDPAVFRATHELVLELVRAGKLHGLRIDHVDGLAAPTTYLRQLREAVTEAGAPPDFPIYVEKILGVGEALPAEWPVDGTTGYEALNEISGVLIDPAGPDSMIAVAERITGDSTPFEAVLRAAKAEVLDTLFAGELEGLTTQLVELAQRDIATAEIGAVRGRRAIAQLLVELPVYRVYPEEGGIGASEAETLAGAAQGARAALDPGDHPALDLVVRLIETPQDPAELDFARRLQQLSGPVMAKSLEDTACYRSIAVLAANEVGGHPPHLALSVDDFVARSAARRASHPRTLVPTATHDTKRGADTRARLLTIAEAPEDWRAAVQGWTAMNAPLRGETDDGPAPDPVSEYLFYQSSVGAWPADLRPEDAEGLETLAGRLADYMMKAVKEAKLQTKWTTPNEAFEAALRAFVAGAFDPARSAEFIASLHGFVERIAPAAAVTGLAQVVLQATMPGVPDIYQGLEDWDLSLVDPDNRRVPDFARLAAALPERADGLLDGWRDGRIKQFVTHRALALRAAAPELFLQGDVAALPVTGPAAGHVVALLRRHAGMAALAVVPRAPSALMAGATAPHMPAEAWDDTAVEMPSEMPALQDRLRDRTLEPHGSLPLSELLDGMPVGLFAAGLR